MFVCARLRTVPGCGRRVGSVGGTIETEAQPPIENSGAQSFGNLEKPDRLDTIMIDSKAANRLAAWP